MVYSGTHVPGLRSQRQASETTSCHTATHWGLKTSQVLSHNVGEFLWPFHSELVFLRCQKTGDNLYVTFSFWAASVSGQITQKGMPKESTHLSVTLDLSKFAWIGKGYAVYYLDLNTIKQN